MNQMKWYVKTLITLTKKISRSKFTTNIIQSHLLHPKNDSQGGGQDQDQDRDQNQIQNHLIDVRDQKTENQIGGQDLETDQNHVIDQVVQDLETEKPDLSAYLTRGQDLEIGKDAQAPATIG